MYGIHFLFSFLYVCRCFSYWIFLHVHTPLSFSLSLSVFFSFLAYPPFPTPSRLPLRLLFHLFNFFLLSYLLSLFSLLSHVPRGDEKREKAALVLVSLPLYFVATSPGCVYVNLCVYLCVCRCMIECRCCLRSSVKTTALFKRQPTETWSFSPLNPIIMLKNKQFDQATGAYAKPGP